MTSQSRRPSASEELSPHYAALTKDVVFGDIWERDGLSKRDRSLITVAALTALYRTNQLRAHIGLALRNGVTREEIVEVIEHMAVYSGFPNAGNGFEVAREVFDRVDGLTPFVCLIIETCFCTVSRLYVFHVC